MLECDCGSTVEDWRGARGHVQFTDGGPHGEKGEVPDDYRDLFTDLEDADDESDEEDGEQDADDDGSDDADPTPPETEEPDSGPSEPSEDDGDGRTLGDRLKTALYDDAAALWGGDK